MTASVGYYVGIGSAIVAITAVIVSALAGHPSPLSFQAAFRTENPPAMG